MSDRSKEEQKQRIVEAAQVQYGLAIDEWSTDEYDNVIGIIGRWRVSKEDEDQGLYDDDQGALTAQVVGSQQYHNEKVMFTFIPDEQDSGLEVVPFEDIEPIDETYTR